MNLLRPFNPYILVRISKEEEKESKSPKFGSIIIPQSLTFMAYNTQCGEIVDISKGAHKHFPEAKIGHTILIHHFVQGTSAHDARTDHLVHEDELYNYYVVTVTEHNGKMNETYGVWDGKKIIPNKDYIFLEPPVKSEDSMDLSVTESGLLVFNNWTESREEKEYRQAEFKKETQNLALSGTHKSHIQKGIAEKEQEMEKISLDINRKRYLPYKVAYYHPSLLDHYSTISSIGSEDEVYVLNIAAQTIVQFNGKEFVVAKVNYVGGIKPNR